MKVMNTFFEKREETLKAYRAPGVFGEPITRIQGREYRYETLDYLTIGNRWKHAVLDIESTGGAKTITDHYPIVAKLQIRRKAILKNTGRKYMCTTTTYK